MKNDSAGTLDALIEQAAAALRKARHVCVLTGAGISAESGIPTFRDALTGLWEKFNPEDLATPEAFERDPKFVWDWYEFRRELIRKVEPNPGHHALVELARLVPSLTLVTQNVDGLHQRAGSRGVLEYHGNILRDRCTVEQVIADRSEDSRHGLPRCAACGGLLRPDVVWFGEAIPMARWWPQPRLHKTATCSCPSAHRRWSIPPPGLRNLRSTQEPRSSKSIPAARTCRTRLPWC